MSLLSSLAVFAMGVGFAVRFLRQCPPLSREQAQRAAPRRALEERFMRGEIPADEFLAQMRALNEAERGPAPVSESPSPLAGER